MDIPITQKDLERLIKLLKDTKHKDLYAKLWTFNINRKK